MRYKPEANVYVTFPNNVIELNLAFGRILPCLQTHMCTYVRSQLLLFWLWILAGNSVVSGANGLIRWFCGAAGKSKR